MDENPYKAPEIPGNVQQASLERHASMATLLHIIAAIVLGLLAAFFFTAVVANEWAAWARPGKDNPHFAQLKFNANFYRACCYSCVGGALFAAVRGYLKREKSPPASHR
jgi:hypothetical protein